MSDYFRNALVRNIEAAKRVESQLEIESAKVHSHTNAINWELIEAYGASVYNTLLQVDTLEMYDNRRTIKNHLKKLFKK